MKSLKTYKLIYLIVLLLMIFIGIRFVSFVMPLNVDVNTYDTRRFFVYYDKQSFYNYEAYTESASDVKKPLIGLRPSKVFDYPDKDIVLECACTHGNGDAYYVILYKTGYMRYIYGDIINYTGMSDEIRNSLEQYYAGKDVNYTMMEVLQDYETGIKKLNKEEMEFMIKQLDDMENSGNLGKSYDEESFHADTSSVFKGFCYNNKYFSMKPGDTDYNSYMDDVFDLVERLIDAPLVER